jgi:hypothetical protein
VVKLTDVSVGLAAYFFIAEDEVTGNYCVVSIIGYCFHMMQHTDVNTRRTAVLRSEDSVVYRTF